MKHSLVGLGSGLIAFAVLAGGCSGTSSTGLSHPPDAGTLPDAGGSSSEPDASAAGAKPDADASGGQGGATAAGGSSGAAGEAGAPEVCVPGTRSCDGAKVQVCNDAGSAIATERTCSLSQVCKDGACADLGCVPNTTFCSAGNVWSCNDDGTASVLTAHCTTDQFCLEKDRVAVCNATACFAEDPVCSGNTATQCKPDGSGPKPGGDDCGATHQTCYSGSCKDLVCTPGEKLCDGNSAYLCTDGGTARTLLSACTANQMCDPSTGTCQTRICDPGKLSCDATRVVTCNQSGTGWLQSGPDCASTNAICSLGSCKPLVCTPNQTFCQGDDVQTCTADGTSSNLYQTCNKQYGLHCVTSYGGASCYYYSCPPGTAGCNGNLLTTCSADGNSWVAGGTDCSLTNSVCVNAQCKPKVCTPSAQFCADGNVAQCGYDGTSSSVTSVCTFGTYCQAQGTTASCVPTPCLPDTDACVSEKFGHCAADGMSVGSGASDCGAAGKVCTLAGCAASATDTLGTSNQVATANGGTVLLDVISVESPRKLTMIETYLTLPATPSLVWAVYQQNLINGYAQFDLKYQKTTSGSGTGFQSSGAINVSLEAGKTYAIGVSVSSVSSGTFVYYHDPSNSPVALNFAHTLGSFSTPFATTVPVYYYLGAGLYYSRLTTIAP